MKLYLKEPTIEEKEEIIKMCYELQNADDIQKFEGMGNLDIVLDEGYEKWLEQNEIDKHIEDINPNWSNSTKYVLIDEKGHVYGSCSLRHHLKGELLNIGGNISYGIRPSERGKGYGLIQLKLMLEKTSEIGLDKVLITCRENNIGSKKVIEKCCGVADVSVPSRTPGIMESRYWINLDNKNRM